jgi:RNA polymerase sigma-70 factor (ECF subfamily)
VSVDLKSESTSTEIEVDLSTKNINDSQLAMIFAVCNPVISTEAQIGLALNILCGFGAEEIAGAFLTTRDVIYKRLQRAKERLKAEMIRIESPTSAEINERLDTVLMTLYLLFNEGYYSMSQDTSIRTEFCFEAMQLNKLLLENDLSNTPEANALFSLMCFQASRLDARTDEKGEIVLYDDQDTSRWDQMLIEKGKYYLDQALKGYRISKYQLEATIAFWHTYQEDTRDKWENILQLYNKLLLIEYSPIIALNRTYALAKANGKCEAILEAEKIGLVDNLLYHSLMGNLYTDVDNSKAIEHYRIALKLALSNSVRHTILKNISRLMV